MTIHQVDPVLRPVRQALSLQYQASLPLRADSFLWPSPEALVQLLPRLEQDLFGPPTTGERSLVRPAPPYQYRRSFIKHLMSRLQSAIDQAQRDHLPGAEDLEMPEGILERYTELIAIPALDLPSHTGERPVVAIALGPDVPDHKPAPGALEGPTMGANTYFARYLYPNPGSAPLDEAELFQGWAGITVPEESAFVSEGTTGLQTWEASVRLGAHLLANKSALLSKGCKVLELGAGAGFLAALCAQVLQHAGGGQVLATDVAPNVLNRLVQTRRINSLTPEEMRVELFDFWDSMPTRTRWQSALNDVAPGFEVVPEGPTEGQKLLSEFGPTLILAADVVFDPSIIPALVKSLQAALHAAPQGFTPKALVGSTQRNEATYRQFIAQLQDNKLDFRSVELDSYPALTIPARWVEGHGDGMLDYHCFPTAHNPERDGVVELLEVTLGPK